MGLMSVAKVTPVFVEAGGNCAVSAAAVSANTNAVARTVMNFVGSVVFMVWWISKTIWA